MKVINHPIVAHQLTLMRDKNTNSTLFRSCLKCLSNFLAYEATKNLPTISIPVTTPIAKTMGKKAKGPIVLVPILRAGLGMADSFKEMIPNARIGHIGLYRDEETKKPVEYYCKMPNSIKGSIVIMLDPMLATGESAIAAAKIIKRFKPKKIKFVSVVAAPQGIKAFEKAHPDIETFTAAIDTKLDKNAYIVPGLGDAGDRIFGTK